MEDIKESDFFAIPNPIHDVVFPLLNAGLRQPHLKKLWINFNIHFFVFFSNILTKCFLLKNVNFLL